MHLRSGSLQTRTPAPWRLRPAVLLLSLVPFWCLSACGPTIDLTEALEVVDLTGGWWDDGIVHGKNKLVPSVTFRLRKTVDQDIRPLSINVMFRRLVEGAEVELDEVYVQRVEFAEGNQTAPLVMRSETGYTGEPPQSRAEMLQHTNFQDVRAIIYVKRGGPHWVELARYDIPRHLLTK